MTNAKRALAGRLGLMVGVAWLAIPAQAQGINPVYHLARRLEPGITRAELRVAETMGFQAYLDSQLVNYTGLGDVEADVSTYWPLVFQTPRCIQQDCIGVGGNTQVKSKQHLRYARIWRWVYSEQGFYERMGWFWANHLNIDFGKRYLWALMPWFDEHVSRKYTFGSFRKLIHASAGDSPDLATGMLMYLDNISNTCVPPLGGPNGIPNENYARELMELHVLGKDPQVYDEDDVQDLATMFSGWNMTIGGLRHGLAKFYPDRHCEGSYTFFGVTIPADDLTPSEGQAAIDATIDYTRSGVRICPEFIAGKLVRAFLSDVPAPPGSAKEAAIDAAIADATNVFGTDGDIRAMLQAILTEANIRAVLEVTPQSPTLPLYKYMPPWLFLSSLLEGSEAAIDPTRIDKISEELDNLGQRPYSFGPPTGYPEAIGAWVQDQPSRWSFAYRLFENNTSTIVGVTVNVPALYNQLGAGGFNRATCGQQASEILTGGNLSSEDTVILQRYANISQEADSVVMWKVLALGAMAPSYSLY